MATTTCAACHDPLVMTLDPDSDVEDQPSSSTSQAQTVPDDLHLACGCHFHWQCLLDLSPAVSTSLACPNCNTYLSSTTPPSINAVYTSEGSTGEPLDLLPTLKEEAYLSTNPDARPARAMQTMCVEGDVQGILDLLSESDDSERDALLGYQDPLNGMRSGLHLAVENGQLEVFWLLMWLGSGLPQERFPDEVWGLVQALEVGRRGPGGGDIRSLRDESGRTAGDLAAEIEGVWKGIVEAGFFQL